jgi:hypothetical protein
MIVVIQCAARKRPAAGTLYSADGRPVVFVADPESAPHDDYVLYERPDDPYDDKRSWREVLWRYNELNHGNPRDLLPAYKLYENRAYGRLVERFGIENVYILSAGWGLIRADFLTPYYDITFSPSADDYKRRRKSDAYHDFCMLPAATTDDIVFLGGKDYLPLFAQLSRAAPSRKIVFYNSSQAPSFQGITPVRFETSTRTNWHHECANALIDGSLTPS